MAERDMYDPATPVVLAKRLSTCEFCDHRIVPDEEIAKVDGVWVHVDCADIWEPR